MASTARAMLDASKVVDEPAMSSQLLTSKHRSLGMVLNGQRARRTGGDEKARQQSCGPEQHARDKTDGNSEYLRHVPSGHVSSRHLKLTSIGEIVFNSCKEAFHPRTPPIYGGPSIDNRE